MDEQAAALHARLIRNVSEVELEHQQREPRYDTRAARLAPGTVARKLGASIDVVAPGKRSCPYHFHHVQEEMFVILDGCGSLRVAEQLLPIRTGDVIFIPPGPDYPHQIINTSDASLTYLSISTRDYPEVCEYPDSGKYSAIVAGDTDDGFNAIQRREATLDYWDGEP